MKKHRTYSQRKEDVTRNWHLVDAQGQILGRLATKIATKLIGKHKPTYTPHIDGGDYVVVINAAKIEVTGGKENKKLYRRHSGFPGSLKETTLGQMLKRKPTAVITQAVKNMLPKNRTRSQRLARLKVYAGAQHKHQAQFNQGNTKK
ncbi:MAG: 50S ribosomal protein L13 [Candidatus Pacebacteria bacterium]|nr:50S ribosomal protein L13 [Candidatus Paceibacterota bacterium]